MAKRGKDEDGRERDSSPPEEEEETSAAGSDDDRDDASEEEEEEDEASGDDAKADEDEGDEDEDEKAKDEDEDEKDEQGEDKAAASEDDKEDDVVIATQLGDKRYVYSAFLAGGLIFAYILGRALHGLWAWASTKDSVVIFMTKRSSTAWFTSFSDEAKLTVSMLLAGVIAIFTAVRMLRRSGVRDWAYEVAGELVKVKWPTRKEVQSSTIVVLATSAIATAYLFLLDRFWGFVTNKIYGTGS